MTQFTQNAQDTESSSQYAGIRLPGFARTTARALNKQFAAQGTNKYLYSLFAGGPLTEGSQ